MFLFLYRYFRVPIDWLLEPVWCRVARWRAHQLRGMAQYHLDLAEMPGMDAPTQLRLANELNEFAMYLEDDVAS